jgi:Na+:H+ antiporter
VGISWLNLLLVLLAAWLAGAIVMRLGYPSLLGEIAAGVVLGPSLLGWLRSDESTVALGRLGVLLVLFYAGVQIRPGEIVGAARTAFLPALGSFAIPCAVGAAVATRFGQPPLSALLIGTVLGTTSLAALSRVLVELDLLGTRLGQTLIAIALFSVDLVLLVFTGIQGVVRSGSVAPGDLLVVLGKAVAFVAVMVAIGRFGLPPFARLAARVNPAAGRAGQVTILMLVAVGAALLAEAFGLSFIVGGFLAGLFVHPNLLGPGIVGDVTDVMRDVALGLLAPLFYLSAGFGVVLGAYHQNFLLVVSLVLTGILSKAVAGACFCLASGLGWRASLVAAAGLNARGGVDIIIAGMALDLGVISAEIYTALIAAIMAATLTVPALLKLGADWLRRLGELPSRATSLVGPLPDDISKLPSDRPAA